MIRQARNDQLHIKPCPFCGQIPDIRVTFNKPVIECRNGKCGMKPDTFLMTNSTNLKKVAALWNQRPKD